jgi:hypothetical protein
MQNFHSWTTFVQIFKSSIRSKSTITDKYVSLIAKAKSYLKKIVWFRESIAQKVARFFSVQHTKTGKNIFNDQQNVPNWHKLYHLAIKLTKWP